MNKLITFCFLFVAFISFSQEKHDARLLERYTNEELTQIQNNNPEEYEIIVHALKVGISIGGIPAEKDINFNGELDLDPTQDHTYISLGLVLLENQYQYYKFKGTDMMVVVRPKNLITQIK